MAQEQDQIPWAALLYVTGEINYGGRVTDDLDRRLLNCMLRTVYTPKLLKDSYTFSSSGVYRTPQLSSASSGLEEMRAFIQQLPLTEQPEVFGMHDNANMTFQMQVGGVRIRCVTRRRVLSRALKHLAASDRCPAGQPWPVQESEKVLDTILYIQPQLVVPDGGKRPDTIVAELALSIETELPLPLLRAEAGAQTFKPGPGGELNSLATVLSQVRESRPARAIGLG